MVNPNINTASLKALGSSFSRTFGARLADVVNVKDFGARGNALADDTVAIQSAVDAAFGPRSAPNGPNNRHLNKRLYFPAGKYLIGAPIVFYGINGGYVFGDGMGATYIQNTVNGVSFQGQGSITSKDTNGNGILTITSVSSGALLVGSIISGGSLRAGTVICNFLTGTGGVGTYLISGVNQPVVGPHAISGTQASVFYLNGVGYSEFSNMYLKNGGNNGTCFNWDWDKVSPQGGTVIMCRQMAFDTSGGFGARIGYTGFQQDQSTFLDCYYAGSGQNGIGIATYNNNAINNSVIGGNFIDLSIAIFTDGNFGGAIDLIHGVGFQVNAQDIWLQGGAMTPITISGCETESANFFRNDQTANIVNITSCAQRNENPTVFCNSAGITNITSCAVTQGKVTSGIPLSIKNSQFQNTAWLSSFNFHQGPGTQVGYVNLEGLIIGDWGLSLGRVIRNEIFTPNGIRQINLEASSLADPTLLYTSLNIVFNGYANNLDTSTHGWSVSIGSPAVFTFPNSWPHKFLANQALTFTTTGALPTGLSQGVTYYVRATGLGTSTFQVSTSPGGAAVNTSGSQSGVHSMYIPRIMAVGDVVWKNNVVAGGSPGWICTTAGSIIDTAVMKALPNVAA